jgi:hypothetical protein
MERVLLEIEKFESLVSTVPMYHRGGGEISKLEHLFLVKCTIAVYLNLLDIILNATLPLANEIAYWQSLLDNRSWRMLYVVQSKLCLSVTSLIHQRCVRMELIKKGA